jgi:hypothetical protein
MKSMTMKKTIALLPDNLREQRNRHAATGTLPDPLHAEPNCPRTLRVPRALACANPHQASASACSALLSLKIFAGCEDSHASTPQQPSTILRQSALRAAAISNLKFEISNPGPLEF